MLKQDGKPTIERNILQLLENKTEDYKDLVALGICTPFGWKELTYKGVGLLSRKLACFLINQIQVKKGAKLAILSESKPEYGACVFASILAGTTTIPLDIKLTKYELISILNDCQPSVIVVSLDYLKMATELRKELEFLKHIIVMDEVSYDLGLPSLYNIPQNYDNKWRHRSSKSTALIIYTSGTIDAPKGVMISFENMLAQLNDMSMLYRSFFPKENHISSLSILPMSHLFELTVGFSVFLHWGLSIYYTQSLKPKDILKIMREKRIRFMIVVPAFLKLLKGGIENEIKNSGKVKYAAFKAMFTVSKFIPFMSIRKLMFKKIHDKFGGAFAGCISGGAPLDVSVGDFFERIGIRVHQGYGLSETSPVVSVNSEKRNILESVGKPLNSFEVKIDEETSEVLLKGPSVMKGYHNQPELTAQTIDKDGWLHTGDVGKIGKNGHLYITGRIKNMIVLSGGKKVFPEEIEAVLGQSEYFAEVCVMGTQKQTGSKEGTEEITVIIVPSENLKTQYSDAKQLEECIKNEVKLYSERLASYKRPMNVRIQTEPLPRTTTRKIKRGEVKKLLSAV